MEVGKGCYSEHWRRGEEMLVSVSVSVVPR